MIRLFLRVAPLLGLLLPAALQAQQWPASAGSTCRSTDPPPERLVEGRVLDLLTLRPIGGVSVTLRSTVGRGVRILGKTTSGPTGSYVFCNVPPLPGLNVTGDLMAVRSRSVPVDEDPARPVPPIYVQWSKPADVAGVVRDGATLEPLEGVLVELDGRPVRAVTDEEGRFRILGQGAGRFIVRSSHLGYATRTDSVDVASNDKLDFEIHMFEEAVELAPIVVRVRSEAEELRRSAGSRVDVITREQIDALLPQITDLASLLRAGRLPGVTIRSNDRGICIDVIRGETACATLVFVDGVRLVDNRDAVSIHPQTIATIQVLDPMEGMIRFGPPGQNGVLLITLR